MQGTWAERDALRAWLESVSLEDAAIQLFDAGYGFDGLCDISERDLSEIKIGPVMSIQIQTCLI